MNNNLLKLKVVSLFLMVTFFTFSFLHFLDNPEIVQAVISDGENALDVIGQTDSDGNPTYTKGLTNDSNRYLGLGGPGDILLDEANHRLFVCDGNNNSRVLIYNLDTNNDLLDNLPDNILGQVDFVSSVYGATQSTFSVPSSLAYDSINNFLFVGDPSNHRVMIFDTATIIDGEDAVHVLGQADFTSNSYATTQGGLYGPSGLAYDSANNRLFVADRYNNRIMIFDTATITNGEDAVNVWGQSSFTVRLSGNGQKKMYYPTGLNFDNVGHRLFVADTLNNRVMVWDTSSISNNQDAINVLGQSTFNTVSFAHSKNGLYYPSSLSYDNTNNRLFVADSLNKRIIIFDTATIVNGEDAVNVLGQSDFTSYASATTQSGFSSTGGVAYNGTNNKLFVADGGNARLLLFDVSSITNGENAVSVVGQTDIYGNESFIKNNLNNGHPDIGLNTPIDVIVDIVHHRLFVADKNNRRVIIYNLDSSNNLLDYKPDYVLGQGDFFSTVSALTQSGFASIYQMAYDSVNDRLFVADYGNNRIMVFDTTTITNGEDAINVLGQSDFTTKVYPTTKSGLYSPMGVSYDTNNDRLFVADSYNNRIMVFDTATITNGEDAINVLGQSDFTSNSHAVTQSSLWSPEDMDYSTTNNLLFVSDSYNNRVLVFDASSIDNNENAINVLGQSDFVTSQYDLTQSLIDGPYGIGYDSSNEWLYIADSGNNRVLVFDASYNSNSSPTFTSLSATSATDEVGDVSIVSTVNDTDANNLTIQYHYEVGTCGVYSAQATSTISSATDSVSGSLTVTNNVVTGVNTASSDTIVTSTWDISADSLTPNTEYCLYSFTNDGTVDSDVSTTTVTLNPAKPLSLSASANGQTSANLSWSANNNPNTTVYKIYSGSTLYGSTTSTSYTVTGLTAGTSYTFTVRAIYNSDNTSYVESDSSSITTSAIANFVILTLSNDNATPSYQFLSKLGDIHTAVVDDIIDDGGTLKAQLTIHSNPATVTLAAGESQNIDTNGNGSNDMIVTMNSVSSGSANFTLTFLSAGSSNIYDNPPKVIEGTKAITINSGEATTKTRGVTLNFNVENAELMAIANNAEFEDVSFEKYNSTKDWTLSEGNGLKTVYAKFRSAQGGTIIYSGQITLTGQSTDAKDEVVEIINDNSNCPLTKEQAYKTTINKSVYYITTNCTKRAFQRSDIYFSYFTSWKDVNLTDSKTLNLIPNDNLGFMPWGPKYDPKYGALVKTVTDPKVYLLLNNNKYWITNETTFNQLNYNWNWIEDIDQRLLEKYTTKEEITDTTTHPNYTLIKYENDPKVYRLEPDTTNPEQQVKRHIPNETEFNKLNFRFDRVVTVPDSEVYSEGENLES